LHKRWLSIEDAQVNGKILGSENTSPVHCALLLLASASLHVFEKQACETDRLLLRRRRAKRTTAVEPWAIRIDRTR